jgi:hypothetical protein
MLLSGDRLKELSLYNHVSAIATCKQLCNETILTELVLQKL